MFKYSIYIAFLIFLTNLVNAQGDDNEMNLNGIVYDQQTGEALIGVNIYNKESKKGTVSDSKGYYELNLESELIP